MSTEFGVTMRRMAGGRRESDAVDRIVEQWESMRPDLDVGPIEVVGRLSRITRLVERRLDDNFSRHGIESWMYDVLATLYRSGPPHELTAGELQRQTMVTTGAMTNRIDRLVGRGFVERAATDDRRKVLVRLTDGGRRCVESVVDDHLATERAILGALSGNQAAELAHLLRALLLGLDDRPG